ncbi:uncharacterized protein LOC134253840 [Saccostrea cucullata]|uniref:uncharacterized protein LOC134253840 n=1 Tax=Saccostrea cuccullata TaxID=36930 RepID=UPI002ED4A83C
MYVCTRRISICTAELENFQNVVNAYASKRHSYNPPSYRCRNRLAALHHNHHINRNVLVKKDGATQFQELQQKSGRWAVYPVKEKKKIPYIPSLQEKILLSRVTDEVGMNQPVVLEVDDPRRLSSHLAPIPPPSTEQLVVEQKSRFLQQERDN